MSNNPRNHNVWHELLDTLKNSFADGGALAVGWGYGRRKPKKESDPEAGPNHTEQDQQ